MAILKDDGSVLYSNDSLARLFECETLPKTNTSSPSKVGINNDHALQARKMLEGVRIKQHEFDAELKHAADKTANDQSVWDFVAKNCDGATYEILTSPVFNSAPVSEDQRKLISNGPDFGGEQGADDVSSTQLIRAD